MTKKKHIMSTSMSTVTVSTVSAMSHVKSVHDQLYDFISQPVDIITKSLFALKAKLITLTNNSYMIKFGEESQFLASELFQLYLKGLIFRQGQVLSVPYMTPIDVFRLPAESQESIRNLVPDHYIITKTGTLLKLSFYDGNWNLSTNGASNAFTVSHMSVSTESFGSLFAKFAQIDESKCSLNGYALDKSCTYVFILSSEESSSGLLYHATTINNMTLIENSDYIGVTQFDKISGGVHGLELFDHLNVNYTSIVKTSDGYIQRYLYSAQLENILIDYARGRALRGFNYQPYADKIARYCERLNALIVLLRLNYFKINRYHEKISVGRITFQIIRRIHGKYLTVLRPNKLFVNDNFISQFLSIECTTREIFCLLEESKQVSTPVNPY